MKYQSELIKEIVEARGHKKSSLHYESECAETWIEEAKGAYPKLCDYEGEWLNYISILDDTGGEFPYETITDVTEATVDNVVPYAYKSAVLKGQSLVNLLEVDGEYALASVTSTDYDIRTNKSVKFTIKEAATANYYPVVYFKDYSMFKPNTKYLALFDDLGTNDYFYQISIKTFRGGGEIAKKETSKRLARGKILFTTRENLSDVVERQAIILETGNRNYKAGDIIHIENIRVIEYREGMENWDIPYFDGMQSVKMPVLTTYTNLFTGFINRGYIMSNGKVGALGNNQNMLSDFIEVKSNSIAFRRFKKDGTPVNSFGEFAFYDKDKKHLGNRTSKDKVDECVTLPNNTRYIRIWSKPVDEDNNGGWDELAVLIYSNEAPSQIKSYPVNETSILTVNEDVTLRGIGDSSKRVEDELDCLTGELTQRVSEIVLDGSQEEISVNTSNVNTAVIIFKSIKTGLSADGVCISDKLPFKANSSEDFEHMRLNVNGNVCLWINKTKFEELTVAGVKKYLLQNPITVQYPLVTESVKTVDLSIQDQNGKTLSVIKPIEGTMHLSTSSDTIKPLFSGEIPVEAITQNLASFIDLEMEE